MLFSPPYRNPFRRLSAGVLLLSLGCLGFFLGGWEGIFRPLPIHGPSMCGTLWGPSLSMPCQRCELEVRFHDWPPPTRVRCWNCGLQQSPDQAVSLPADKVLVDTRAFGKRWFRQGQPVRGDLVAVELSGSRAVKRLVGLPGDRLSIKDGELQVNGQRVDRQLQHPPDPIAVHIAVLSQPAAEAEGGPTMARRWLPVPIVGGDQDGGSAEEPHETWWRYHHFCVHSGQPDQIRDDDPYNATIPRKLHAVGDLQIRLQFRLPQAAVIKVAFWRPDAPAAFQRQFPAGSHDVGLASDGGPEESWRPIPLNRSLPVVDARHPVAVAGWSPSPTSPCRATLLRRPYWEVAPKHRLQWPGDTIVLPPDHYFVVGDNLAISADSREDPLGVRSEHLLGRVQKRPW